MRTNKTTVEIDGENHNFYFEKSGGSKGAGKTGEEDDKLYQSGMLLRADSDDKYIVIEKKTYAQTADHDEYTSYAKLEDAKEFLEVVGNAKVDSLAGDHEANDNINLGNGSDKKFEDLSEAYTFDYTQLPTETDVIEKEYILVNTSGKVIDGNSKSKDGNDYVYVTTKSEKDGVSHIVGVYVED